MSPAAAVAGVARRILPPEEFTTPAEFFHGKRKANGNGTRQADGNGERKAHGHRKRKANGNGTRKRNGNGDAMTTP